MQRKNIVLVSVVALAALVFAFPELSALLPGWPGYGIGLFIRWNEPVIAMTHVRIIDGTGASPIEDGSVVVANGTIQAAGPFSQVAIPATAKVLDFRGYSVIPGLVGMHDHLFIRCAAVPADTRKWDSAFPVSILPAASPRSGWRGPSSLISTCAQESNRPRLARWSQHSALRPLSQRMDFARPGSSNGQRVGRSRRRIVQGLHQSLEFRTLGRYRCRA